MSLVSSVVGSGSARLVEYSSSTEDKIQLQLLMTDLMESPHPIGLRFSLESGLNTLAQSPDFVVGQRFFTLHPGQSLRLSHMDIRYLFELQNLSGITPLQYAEPLPDGLYQFCFQAYDYYTRRVLSAKSCSTVRLSQYAPAQLSFPENGEKVQAMMPYSGGLGLVFQWMPRQIAPHTQYIFTLKEIWDLEQSPVSAFLSAAVLWREQTPASTLYYGLDKPQLIPGKRYAWQVESKSIPPLLGENSTNNQGIYKNKGLSEIYYFDYVQNCPTPSLLLAKNLGRGRVELRWTMAAAPSGDYRVQYRKKGTQSPWLSHQSEQPTVILTGLEDRTTYEYRTGAACGRDAYAYSGISYFTTDSKASSNPNYQCGIMPAVDIQNTNPLQQALGVNEVFMAGDFPVTVIEAQGSQGVYSGTGYIEVPYLSDTKIKVSFHYIKLNTDKKLIGGLVETTYDPEESAVHHASSTLGESLGDAGLQERDVDYAIGDIQYIPSPSPGRIRVYGTGENPSRQDFVGGRDYQIKDKQGHIWTVDEKGNVHKAGQVAQGGASNHRNTLGITGEGTKAEITQYTATGIHIEWDDAPSRYAYDSPQKSQLPPHLYPAVKDAQGNTLRVPYKASLNKQTEFFDAKLSISDPALEHAQVIFKTLSSGKAIEAEELSKTATQRHYRLRLVGSFDYAEEEVIAVLMPKEADAKQRVISSFRWVHISPKTIQLSLVPLDAEAKAKLPAQTAILQQIYGKVGIEFTIKEEPLLDISDIVKEQENIETEDRDWLSTYSPVMQQINARYRDKSPRYVLFFTQRRSTTSLRGYMRLDGKFGYVFGEADDKTPAHELGHGIFKLEHPTTQGQGLLSSQSPHGTLLSHLEWKQINDPKFRLYAFQNRGEGEQNQYAHLALTPSGKIIDTFYQNNQQISVIILIAKNYTVDRIKYAGVEYTWNGAVFTAEGKPNISVKKINRTLNDKVNLFRSRGDGCMYDYVLIHWSSDDENTTDVQAKIADKIKGFKDTDWTLSPLDIRDSACNNNFAQELLKKDLQECVKTELQSGIKNLKDAIKLTDAEKVVSTVNSTCMSAIRNLSYTEIERLITILSGQSGLKENSELAILRLMTAIKTGDYADFYAYLENDGNRILKHLIAEMDDASIYFLTDKKNYTNFVGALVTMFRQAPVSLEKRWSAGADDFAARVVNVNPVDYSSDTSSFSPKFTFKHNDGTYDSYTGNITLNDVYTTYQYNAFETHGSGVTKTEHREKITEVSPLTPIIIVPDGDRLPLIATALGEHSIGNGGYIVPAVLLKYQADKIRNDYIEKGVVTTLDLATIYLSGGAALATKVGWIRRAWALAEVAGAVGNITVNAGATSPEVQQAVDAYNAVMGIIGVKNVAQGGYKFVKNMPRQTKELLQSNKGLRELLTVKYTEWKTLTTKIDKLSDAEKKLITEQEQVWKALGVVDNELSQSITKVKNVKAVINSVKDLVEDIVSKRGNMRKVLDIPEGKAYAKKYFEQMVKQGNFEDWWAKAKRYDVNDELNFEVHHVIPISVLKENDKLQEILLWAEQNSKKFDFNGIDNGIPLQKKKALIDLNGHANHPKYDRAMEQKIDAICRDSNLDNIGKFEEIQDLINNTKTKLEKEVLLGNKDVNQIINLE